MSIAPSRMLPTLRQLEYVRIGDRPPRSIPTSSAIAICVVLAVRSFDDRPNVFSFFPKEKKRKEKTKKQPTQKETFWCVTREMFDDDDNERREIKPKRFERHCFRKGDLPPLVRAESGAVVAARQARTTLVDLLHQNPLEKRKKKMKMMQTGKYFT